MPRSVKVKKSDKAFGGMKMGKTGKKGFHSPSYYGARSIRKAR